MTLIDWVQEQLREVVFWGHLAIRYEDEENLREQVSLFVSQCARDPEAKPLRVRMDPGYLDIYEEEVARSMTRAERLRDIDQELELLDQKIRVLKRALAQKREEP